MKIAPNEWKGEKEDTKQSLCKHFEPDWLDAQTRLAIVRD